MIHRQRAYGIARHALGQADAHRTTGCRRRELGKVALDVERAAVERGAGIADAVDHDARLDASNGTGIQFRVISGRQGGRSRENQRKGAEKTAFAMTCSPFVRCLRGIRRQLHAQHIAQIVDVVSEIIVHRDIDVAADGVEAVIALARAVHVEHHPALEMLLAQHIEHGREVHAAAAQIVIDATPACASPGSASRCCRDIWRRCP